MHRRMTSDVLKDYLSSAHTIIMLCRAHADMFDLSMEQAEDAAYLITLSIIELEELQIDLQILHRASKEMLGLPLIS